MYPRRMPRPRWQERAARRGLGHEWFIISSKAEPLADVLETCASCAVREECLAFALADPDMVGVWGGTTEARDVTMPEIPPHHGDLDSHNGWISSRGPGQSKQAGRMIRSAIRGGTARARCHRVTAPGRNR